MFRLLDDENNAFRYKPAKKCVTSRIHICVSILCVTFFLIVVFLVITAKSGRVQVLYINSDNLNVTTNDKFLSIALDSSVIQDGFKDFNTTNPKLIKLMKALGPGYLRIGGTMADRLIFNSSLTPQNHTNSVDEGSYLNEYDRVDEDANFTISGLQWLDLNNFAKLTGFQIIFDLNSLRRNEDGSWDSSNAEELIAFSNEHNLNLHWELGNEPNNYRHKFNYEVDPLQLADDFGSLRDILRRFPKYSKSLLVGPDVTRPQVASVATDSEHYLDKFLSKAADIVDVVTFHQYYLNGRTATINDFIDPITFDILKWQITSVKEIATKNNITNKPIWLGETSSAYGGGATNLSDRFVSTFLWLDKLAVSAKYGIEVILRQSIVKGNYALLTKDYDPTPNWWVSVLYKKLVGHQVMECYTATQLKVRLYCQLYKNRTAISVFGMNLNGYPARIRMQGAIAANSMDLKWLTVDAYILTTKNELDSEKIYLNQVLLQLTEDNEVPNFEPKTVSVYPYIEIPPYSLIFWVISNN